MFAAFTYEDDYDCYAGRNLVPVGDHERNHVFDLASKRYQSVAFSYLGVNAVTVHSCRAVYTIETKPDAEYRFDFERVPGGCVTTAVEIEGGNETRVPLIKREYKTPFWHSAGPWCVADTRFLGSSNLATPRTAKDH